MAVTATVCRLLQPSGPQRGSQHQEKRYYNEKRAIRRDGRITCCATQAVDIGLLIQIWCANHMSLTGLKP
ncbi:hypothetical protein L249_6038 [Ophiocordyceps polyrhachis-furcata BCC 54312]|uniref:Uncharacterized protein n=1 Tax=Ophiocordyceps polyrhachis-furcata BCC 54312 TaxID=1330021 RepID=A0A367LIH6_9HYPO|nr:hypothetical protein L249_6038 [Ophiocordyceps polyrhachis-furcata BCC 54312]